MIVVVVAAAHFVDVAIDAASSNSEAVSNPPTKAIVVRWEPGTHPSLSSQDVIVAACSNILERHVVIVVARGRDRRRHRMDSEDEVGQRP